MGHAKASSSSVTSIKRSRSSSPADTAGSSPASATTDAAVKSILNSRKCWRSLKGKEEPVWPPHLEAALIEGLEKYKPSESKSTRALGRFPMRNKFVADFIYDTTRVRRTPKQVGSRIQQLRDTQSGKQILKVISDRHYEMMHPTRSSASFQGKSSSAAAAAVAVATACTLQPSASLVPNLSPSHIWVQALPASAAWRFGAYPAHMGDLYSSVARPLRMVNPTVTFTSLSQTPCQSIFTVFRDSQLIHQEVAVVSISPSTSGSSSSSSSAPCWVYSTTLVPKFWSHLCDSEEPMSYTVHQEVVRVPVATHTAQPPILSVYYHFVNGGASTPPLSPRSSSGDSETDATSSLSRESSPNYAPRLDDVDVKPFVVGAGRTPLDAYVPHHHPHHHHHASPPSLVYAYEEGYSSGSAPTTPLEMHGVDVEHWSYAHGGNGMQDMLAVSCDPIFEPYINL